MDKSFFYIERLVITKSGNHVYDEKFHRGINVIRGDHSVGKTTILEMIFYVLGGEIKENQWLYPADKCDEIFCQLNINGNVFTIKRIIQRGGVPPISIRSGIYDEKESEPWKTFGSRRSEDGAKMSFSQQLFELLGWDTHKSEDYANLTMHQILRCLYVDQETSSTKILRAEDNPKGDSEGIRIAIFEFLLGLDNLDTHSLRQQLLIAERQFEKLSSDLSAMYRVLGIDAVLTLSILENNIITNMNEIIRLVEEPLKVKSDNELSEERDRLYKSLAKKVDLLSRQMQNFKQELLLTNGEIIDCDLYDKSLRFRKKSLLESQSSYDAIGLVKYNSCPCCLQKLSVTDDNQCHLCKATLVESKHDNNYMEILTELDFQINSNKKTWEDYIEKKTDFESAIRILEGQLAVAQSELESAAKIIDFAFQETLDNSKKIGYLEAENDNLRKKIEITKELENSKSQKESLQSKISELQTKIEAATAANEKRRKIVYNGICENVVDIINKDKRANGKPYEKVFDEATASDIEIDFAKDRILFDGRVKFSGSSNYVKKNAFHLSALLESLDDNSYRLPRFLMLDAIENGGMKAFRSHNFQKILIEMFKDRDDFQLIFCTSMVVDELNNEVFGVGPYYEGNVIDFETKK